MRRMIGAFSTWTVAANNHPGRDRPTPRPCGIWRFRLPSNVRHTITLSRPPPSAISGWSGDLLGALPDGWRSGAGIPGEPLSHWVPGRTRPGRSCVLGIVSAQAPPWRRIAVGTAPEHSTRLCDCRCYAAQNGATPQLCSFTGGSLYSRSFATTTAHPGRAPVSIWKSWAFASAESPTE
jgi:hypothetical protein